MKNQIKKKSQAKLNLEEIANVFTRKIPKCGIAATFIQTKEISPNQVENTFYFFTKH